MKKALRILGILLSSLIAVLAIGYFILNKPLPEGKAGPEADILAEQMMASLNKQAWDNTKNVSWTFKGVHHYQWDREAHLVTVSWDEHQIRLDPESKSGIALKGENYTAQEVQELINTAWDYFNNDSFWLCAPFKAFDPGVERSIVTLKDGKQGLKVTYTSGGTTPGDSYVWILGEDYKPVAVKMWVSILPIGGMEFSWENYKTLPSGAMVAQDHWLYGAVNIELHDIN